MIHPEAISARVFPEPVIDKPAVFYKTADGGNRCWCGYYISGRGGTEMFAELAHRIEHLEKMIEGK